MYKYLINSVQVTPISGDTKLQYREEREYGRKFKRLFLDGDVILCGGADYSNLKSVFDSLDYNTKYSEQSFIIQQQCNSQWLEVFNGYFTIFDCEIDEDKCLIKIKEIKPNDEYRFLDKADVQYNILDKITPDVTIRSTSNIKLEYFTCSGNTYYPLAHFQLIEGCVLGLTSLLDYMYPPTPISPNAETGCLPTGVGFSRYKCEFSNVISAMYGGSACWSADYRVTWVRQYEITLDEDGSPVSPPPTTGGSWTQDASMVIGGLPAHKWIRSTPYNHSSIFPVSPELYQFNRSARWTDCTTIYQLIIPTSPSVYYTRGRRLRSVIGFFGTELAGLQIYSDFLYGTNYVTGVNPNPLNNIGVYQMSDVKDPDSTEPATILNISFNELMSKICNTLNAYWFIDQGKIRVEHISWWDNLELGLDLTQGNYPEYIKNQNHYTFDKFESYKNEQFRWADKVTGVDFIGTDISYSLPCVDKYTDNNKTYDAGITTDLEAIENDPSGFSDAGIVFICYEQNGVTFDVAIEEGLLSEIEYKNAHLGWANLHYNYWRHNRSLPLGNMNGVPTGFLSWKKIKKQVDLNVPICCDVFDADKLVNTPLGQGEVESAEIDLSKNTLKLSLKYYD